jgi:hypothetical protein
MTPQSLPTLPAKHDELIPYLAKHSTTSMIELLEPYKTYDAKVRELFAQDPQNLSLSDPFVNVVPVFRNGHASNLKIRARNLKSESREEQDRYIMPLKDEDRKPHNSPAGNLFSYDLVIVHDILILFSGPNSQGFPTQLQCLH